ncbi:MAG: hypothetical protein Q9214_001642 [Letrouitia sp. 1 TL-2023]
MIGGLSAALPIGRLYGMYDAKLLYITSIALFMTGSALCGGAPEMAALIVGRVIAGAGGNGMYVGVLTLLSVNTTEKERPTYLAFIGLVYGIGMLLRIIRDNTLYFQKGRGTVIGPIIGGAFADSSATWRWGFYINLIVGAVFAPIYLILLPPFIPRPSESIPAKLKNMDYLGTMLQGGAFVSVVMAISFGGTTYAWNSGQTITLFMKEPVLLFIAMAAVNAGSYVCMYYIPLYFQFTKGVESLASGVRLLPFIIAGTLVILINGGLMSKNGFYMPWYLIGSTIVLIGAVLLSRIDLHTSPARVYGYEILLGVGVGAYLQAGYAVIQGVLEPVHMAYGVSFMLLGQLGGIALGLSISGAVFVNTALNGLQRVLPDVLRSQLEGAISGTSGDFLRTLDGRERVESLEVVMGSLRKAFVLVYVARAVSLGASALLSRRRLNLAPAGGGG